MTNFSINYTSAPTRYLIRFASQTGPQGPQGPQGLQGAQNEGVGQMHTWFARQFNIATASTTANANKRLHLMTCGDSLAARVAGWIGWYFQRAYGGAGKDGGFIGQGTLVADPVSFFVPGGTFPGLNGDASLVSSDFAIWPSGKYYSVGPAGSIRWDTFTTVTCAEVRVYYIAEPGAAVFVIETSPDNTTWTQQGASINANNGATIGAIAKRTFNEAKVNIRARVTSGSGRVKIIGAYTGYATSVAGFDGSHVFLEGISPTSFCMCPSEIYTPIVSDLNPALITFHFDDPVSEYANNWTKLMAFAKAGDSSRSVLFIGNGPRQSDGDVQMRAVAEYMRAKVASENIGFFDCMAAVGPWARLNGLGWQGDAIHHDSRAYAYCASMLIKQLGLTTIFDKITADIANDKTSTDILSMGRAFSDAPIVITADTTFGVGGDIAWKRDLNLKAKDGTLWGRFSVNQLVNPNQFPEQIYRPNNPYGNPTNPYTAQTTGVVDWINANKQFLRDTATGLSIGVGPYTSRLTPIFTSISANSEFTFTVPVSGVSQGNGTSNGFSVNIGWLNAIDAGIIVKQAWVSGTNTVSITLRNVTGGAITPAANSVYVVCFSSQ